MAIYNGGLNIIAPDISGKEDKSNKVTAWSSTTTHEHYPSEKLVKSALDTKVNTANVLTFGEIQEATDLTGKVASASSVAYLKDLQGIQRISLIPTVQYIELTDMVALQGIVFVTGSINRNFGTGAGRDIIALQNGLVIAQDFSAPISCYDGVVGEISGSSGSSYIKANISSISGDGKFNFFFRVKSA